MNISENVEPETTEAEIGHMQSQVYRFLLDINLLLCYAIFSQDTHCSVLSVPLGTTNANHLKRCRVQSSTDEEVCNGQIRNHADNERTAAAKSHRKGQETVQPVDGVKSFRSVNLRADFD